MKSTLQSNHRTSPVAARGPESSFTLIELLTVIAIIAVLAGLLFPALTASRRAAKETTARLKISQVATCFRSYYNDYAVWPSNPTNGALWVSILTGNSGIDGSVTNNPRKIIYMEFKAAETNSTGILDPWSQAYSIGFDTNYDNKIDIFGLGAAPNNSSPPTASDVGANTNTSFVIWSIGDPKKRNVLGSWK